MPYLTIISFSIIPVYLALGLIAFFRNTKSTANRIFMVMVLLLILWSFCLGMIHFTTNRETALLYYRIGLFQTATMPSFLFYFIIRLTGTKSVLSRPPFIILSFTLSLLFYTASLLFPSSFYTDMVRNELGWQVSLNLQTPVFPLFILMQTIHHIANTYFLIQWFRKTGKNKEKKQAIFIFTGIFVTFSIILFIETISKIAHIFFIPESSHLVCLIWILAIAFAMKRYGLMKFSPRMALEKVFFSIMDLLIIIDENGKIIRANKRIQPLLGFSNEELKGKPISNFFTMEFIRENAAISMQLKENKFVSFNLLDRNGDPVPLSVAVLEMTDNHGDLTGFMIIGHDETETAQRIKAEKALRESELLYGMTINSMRDFIHVIDRQTNVYLMNTAISRYLNNYMIKPGETRLHELFPFLTKKVYDQYEAVFKSGLPLITEEDNFIDGNRIYTETRKIPIKHDGTVEKVVTIIRDITDKKIMEQRLLQSEITETIGILAGGIAHDYNNILSGILGNIDLIRHFNYDMEQAREIIQEAEKACLTAKDLTQQLLTFSRGGVPVKKAGSIVTCVEKTVSFFLRGSGIRCEIEKESEDVWLVEFDDQQMSRVFQNLTLNAKQAMSNKGILTIKFLNKQINSRAGFPLQEGPYVVISVIDQGIGIRNEDLPHIFNPYFSTKMEGFGLGLATAFSVIKRHNGYIDVSSIPGKGTTFNIYLPAFTGKMEPVKKKKKPDFKRGTGRILVIDDEESVRRVLSRMLEKLGFQSVLVENGKKALEIFDSQTKMGEVFDAVILDLTIPGDINWNETITGLKTIQPGVKVIICSGYSDDPVMAHYVEMGFKGVIRKPFLLEELADTFHSVLGKES
ncbi:MAG: PAS domain S-box protein [Spirochaetales bacterium]|nr:PAS domain S-box protein [Spirochaetales bacterium]